MAEKMLKTRIQHKHDIQENWEKATGFVPLAGELIIYDVDAEHSTPRFKIGDGVIQDGKVIGTNVNDLPFAEMGSGTVDPLTEFWDGTVATAFAGGTGTKTDPYLIQTPSQLALMLELFGDNGKYFKLMNDLYMANMDYFFFDEYDEYDIPMWYNTTYIEGTAYVYENKKSNRGTFNGYVDGGYNTIYCLYSEGIIGAFIPVFANGEIKNLKIDYSIFKGSSNAAAFIGRTGRDSYPNGEILIDGCVSGKFNFIEGSENTTGCGGFIGYATVNNNITIKNSCSLTPQSSIKSGQSWKANGMIGETYNTIYRISNCFSVAKPFDTNSEAARLSKETYYPYQVIYSATDRTLNYNEVGTFTKVDNNKVIGAGALTVMHSLYGFVEQYEDYPIISGFDAETKSSQIAELDRQLQDKQDKFAGVTKYGSDNKTIILETIDDVGTAGLYLVGNTAGLGSYSDITLNTNGNIDLYAPNGKVNYNNKEIATKEDVEELSTEFETIGREIYTGTFGSKDKLQLLKGTKSLDVDEWDGTDNISGEDIKINYDQNVFHKTSGTNGDAYYFYALQKGKDYTIQITSIEGAAYLYACYSTDYQNIQTTDSEMIHIKTFDSANTVYTFNTDSVQAPSYYVMCVLSTYGNSATWDIITKNNAHTLEGSGTANDPYLIDNGTKLSYFIKNNNNSYKYYKLTKDIDLGGYEWITSKDIDSSFRGSINGNYHVISGLNISNSTDEVTTYATEIEEDVNQPPGHHRYTFPITALNTNKAYNIYSYDLTIPKYDQWLTHEYLGIGYINSTTGETKTSSIEVTGDGQNVKGELTIPAGCQFYVDVSGVLSSSSYVTAKHFYYTGLIPFASNVVVCNLALKNIKIKGYAPYSCGGIVGRFHQGNGATFENCYVEGKMSGTDGGAIIGGSGDNVTITNCGCNVDFSDCTGYAGMVADYWGEQKYTFTNCYSNGALMGKCGSSTVVTNGYCITKGSGDNYSTIITLSEMNSVKNMPGLEEAFIDVENGTPYLKSVYTVPVVNTPDNTLYVGDGSTGIKLDTNEAGYILNTETSTDLLSNTNIYVNSKSDEEYFALKYIKSQILKEVVKENYENIEKNTADISSILPLVAMIPSMTTRSINVYKTAAAGTWTLKPNSVVMLTGQDAGANIKYIINDTTYNHKYTFFITGQLVNGNAKTYIIHANAISLMGSGIGNWMFDGIKNGQSITIEYPQNTNVIEFANDPITTLAPTSMLDVLKNEIAEEGTW